MESYLALQEHLVPGDRIALFHQSHEAQYAEPPFSRVRPVPGTHVVLMHENQAAEIARTPLGELPLHVQPHLLDVSGTQARYRPPVGWWDLLDIAIVSILIYESLKLIRGTRAAQMAVGSLLLVGLFYVSRLAPLQTLNWMIRNVLVYVAFAAIVIFQSDIRRALAHFGRAPFFRYFIRQEAVDETIEEIVVAAGVVQPGTKFARAANKIATRDVAKAKALLAEAGVSALELNLYCLTDSVSQSTAQIIQSSLGEAGITVNIQPTEDAAYWALGDKTKGDGYKNIELVLMNFAWNGLGGLVEGRSWTPPA